MVTFLGEKKKSAIVTWTAPDTGVELQTTAGPEGVDELEEDEEGELDGVDEWDVAVEVPGELGIRM
jgi:hypothetical protein